MAMPLRGNALLKFLVPAAILVVILIVVMGRDGETAGVAVDDDSPALHLTDEEITALGIEADTPQDTVATLVGQLHRTQREIQAMRDETQELKNQNQQLAQQQSTNIDERVRAAVERERARMTAEMSQRQNSLLSTFQQQLDSLKGGNSEMPIGLGLDGSDGPEVVGGDGQSLTWVDPLDAPQVDTRGRSSNRETPQFPLSFGEASTAVANASRRTATALESKFTGEPDASTVEPVYTVPQNSTLMGSLATTALLGRVPVNGTVSDPYPFKALIGADNLTANGIEIPDVEAAVVSGTATGDWTLSCVRGTIESMTFVFTDGRIRTLPTPDDVNGGSRGSNDNSDGIGWISDPFGIPCVSGVRRSNAKEYLGTQSLVTAAGAGVASLLSDDDDTSFSSMGADGTVTQAMTGQQAVGQILMQGVNDMSSWVNQLYGEAFAAVYVPPGKEVAIHITKQLAIDYETEGRKVRYDRTDVSAYALP